MMILPRLRYAQPLWSALRWHPEDSLPSDTRLHGSLIPTITALELQHAHALPYQPVTEVGREYVHAHLKIAV